MIDCVEFKRVAKGLGVRLQIRLSYLVIFGMKNYPVMTDEGMRTFIGISGAGVYFRSAYIIAF